MLNQPYVLEVFVNDHRSNLLKGAEANRRACQVKKERRAQANLLQRMAAHLRGSLIGPVRQLAEVTFFTDEAVTDVPH